MLSKQRGWLSLTLVLSGLGVLFLGTTFWLAQLLNHHSAFVPNYEKRVTMFKSLTHKARQGGRWRPQQGEHWIF